MKNFMLLIAKMFLGKGIDKKFPFLLRVYKFIFSSVNDTREYTVSIPLQSKLIVSGNDLGLGSFLRTKGEYEPQLTKQFIAALKEGDIVLDIGANVGYYTVLASKLVGKKGKVYAFEPSPQSLPLLKKNLAFNNCKNVIVVEKALGKNEDEHVAFYLDKANPGESRLAGHGQRETMKIESTTLDNFVTKNNIKKIAVIKVDVEGREPWVFAGGKEVLTAANTKLFFECNQNALAEVGYSVSQLLSMVTDYKFVIKEMIDESEKKSIPFDQEIFKKKLEKVNYLNLFAEKS
jgi:FkbM family methyltransferase